MGNSYEPSVLDRLHKAEMVILKDFQAICEKYDINYLSIDDDINFEKYFRIPT